MSEKVKYDDFLIISSFRPAVVDRKTYLLLKFTLYQGYLLSNL